MEEICRPKRNLPYFCAFLLLTLSQNLRRILTQLFRFSPVALNYLINIVSELKKILPQPVRFPLIAFKDLIRIVLEFKKNPDTAGSFPPVALNKSPN